MVWLYAFLVYSYQTPLYLMFYHFRPHTFIFLKCFIWEVLGLFLDNINNKICFGYLDTLLLCMFMSLPIPAQTCAECTKTCFYISFRKTGLLLEDQEAFIGKVNYCFIILLWIWHWNGKQQCALSEFFVTQRMSVVSCFQGQVQI